MKNLTLTLLLCFLIYLPLWGQGRQDSTQWGEGRTKTALNLRTGPGTQYSKEKTLPAGTKINIHEKTKNGWLKVSVPPDNSPLYAKGEFVEITSAIPAVEKKTDWVKYFHIKELFPGTSKKMADICLIVAALLVVITQSVTKDKLTIGTATLAGLVLIIASVLQLIAISTPDFYGLWWMFDSIEKFLFGLVVLVIAVVVTFKQLILTIEICNELTDRTTGDDSKFFTGYASIFILLLLAYICSRFSHTASLWVLRALAVYQAYFVLSVLYKAIKGDCGFLAAVYSLIVYAVAAIGLVCMAILCIGPIVAIAIVCLLIAAVLRDKTCYECRTYDNDWCHLKKMKVGGGRKACNRFEPRK